MGLEEDESNIQTPRSSSLNKETMMPCDIKSKSSKFFQKQPNLSSTQNNIQAIQPNFDIIMKTQVLQS